jgi:glycosyltransferase involved in cell wall biosynthesis
MIGVIIPAHDEAESIGECVRSVKLAAEHPEISAERVLVIVVADACTDDTESIAAAAGALVLSIRKRSVGQARTIGASLALSSGARWLSFTDADSTVPNDWIAQQLRCQTDAVCGVIAIADWHCHSRAVREEFETTYHDRDGHRHIHGANLGVSASAYQASGGFQPVDFNEDVALVDTLIATGATVSWTNKVRVQTSARTGFRAPWGFGATLLSASKRLANVVLEPPAYPSASNASKGSGTDDPVESLPSMA